MKQYSFLPPPTIHHGGEYALGKRKTRRALATKRPLHLVLKAKKNLQGNRPLVEKILRHYGATFGHKFYGLVVNHDHAHLVIKISSRENYKAFIRAITGILAKKLGAGLWKLLPFSRIVGWRRDFRGVMAYLQENYAEALGLLPMQIKTNHYRRPPPR